MQIKKIIKSSYSRLSSYFMLDRTTAKASNCLLKSDQLLWVMASLLCLVYLAVERGHGDQGVPLRRSDRIGGGPARQTEAEGGQGAH